MTQNKVKPDFKIAAGQEPETTYRYSAELNDYIEVPVKNVETDHRTEDGPVYRPEHNNYN